MARLPPHHPPYPPVPSREPPPLFAAGNPGSRHSSNEGDNSDLPRLEKGDRAGVPRRELESGGGSRVAVDEANTKRRKQDPVLQTFHILRKRNTKGDLFDRLYLFLVFMFRHSGTSHSAPRGVAPECARGRSLLHCIEKGY